MKLIIYIRNFKIGSLNKYVLILNKSWIPIRIKNVKTAIKLVFNKRACFVDPVDYSVYNWQEWFSIDIKDEEYIHCSHNKKMKIPEWVILTKYNQIPNYNVKLTKRNIFIRDKYKCQYSGKTVDLKEGDIDHIIPKSRGGKTEWNNLVVCSKDINRAKSNRTPEEAQLELLKKPIKPKFQNLFLDPNKKYPKSFYKLLNKNG